MSAPLSEQQLAEIRARIAGLDASRIAADSKWQAGPVDSKSILPPQTNYAVEDVGKTPHFVVRSSVAVLADQELAEFVAAARQDVPALLAEIERLREHFDKAIAGFNAQSLRVTELRQEVVRARVAGLLDAAAIVDNDDDCGCGGCDTCIPRALARQIRDRAYSVAQGGV